MVTTQEKKTPWVNTNNYLKFHRKMDQLVNGLIVFLGGMAAGCLIDYLTR